MPSGISESAYHMALRYIDEHSEAILARMGGAKPPIESTHRNLSFRLMSAIIEFGAETAADAFVADAFSHDKTLTDMDTYLLHTYGVQGRKLYDPFLTQFQQEKVFLQSHRDLPNIATWNQQVKRSMSTILAMAFHHWRNRYGFNQSFIRTSFFELLEHLLGQPTSLVRQQELIKWARAYFLSQNENQEQAMRITGWYDYFADMSTARWYVANKHTTISAFNWAYRLMCTLSSQDWPSRATTDENFLRSA